MLTSCPEVQIKLSLALPHQVCLDLCFGFGAWQERARGAGCMWSGFGGGGEGRGGKLVEDGPDGI